MILDDLIPVLKNAKKISVLPHISADGDAIGSSLAFAYALSKIGKDATVYLEEEIPRTYMFLPCREKTQIFEQAEGEFDVVVALDTGDTGRLGNRIEIFNKAKITVNIDHHQTNDMFASYNYVDTKASATGEIIYDLIGKMNVEMDTCIANCLYTAIVTDTGGFRYSNTTKRTHEIIAQLIDKGVDVADIAKKVFDTVSLAKTRLTGEAINSLQLFEDGKVAFLTITKEMQKRAGADDEDCDGLVNIGRNIEGVEVAVLLKTAPDGSIKASIRSNAYADVAKVAQKFSGGGHKRAAGCIINSDIDSARDMILEEIRKELNL